MPPIIAIENATGVSQRQSGALGQNTTRNDARHLDAGKAKKRVLWRRLAMRKTMRKRLKTVATSAARHAARENGCTDCKASAKQCCTPPLPARRLSSRVRATVWEREHPRAHRRQERRLTN
jgi:hypothetical protein